MRALLLIALLLAVPSMYLPAAPAKPRRAPIPSEILNREPKLRTRLTLDLPPENIGKLLRHISEKTGVPIRCQGDFFIHPPILLQIQNQEAREVMTQIALVAGGQWFRRDGVYRPMETGTDLESFQIGRDQEIARDAAERIYQSIIPAQRQRMLGQRRPLAFKELTPEQQRWFTTAFNNEYLRYPERYLKETFVSQERVSIRLIPSDNGKPTQLWLCAPQLDDHGREADRPFLIIEVKGSDRT